MRVAWTIAPLAALAVLGAGGAVADAPAPTKPVDLRKYYGRWYEVARVPNQFEKGLACSAPTADYEEDDQGAVTVVQTCHQHSARGPEKVYRAAARILDPGVNAKFRLTFYLVMSKEYWVIDHAQDYRWAIVGDPTGRFVWLFSRQPALSHDTRDSLLARVRALGYDPAKLEFPVQG